MQINIHLTIKKGRPQTAFLIKILFFEPGYPIVLLLFQHFNIGPGNDSPCLVLKFHFENTSV